MTEQILSRTAVELLQLLRTDAWRCPVCVSASRAMRQQVDHLFYESVNDIPTRAAIRKARGFCRAHARLVAQQEDALGSALIFADVLVNEVRALESGELQRLPENPGPFGRMLGQGRQNESPAACPLCIAECETEERIVDAFVEALGNVDLAAAFENSAGLCIPHLRLTRLRCRDTDRWSFVVRCETRALSALVADLQELARKYDYRNAEKPTGAKAEAWRHALKMTSGWMDS